MPSAGPLRTVCWCHCRGTPAVTNGANALGFAKPPASLDPTEASVSHLSHCACGSPLPESNSAQAGGCWVEHRDTQLSLRLGFKKDFFF